MVGFVVATNNVKKRNASNTGWVSRALALTFTGDIIQYNRSIEPTSLEDMLSRSDSRMLMSLFVEQKNTGKHVSKVKVIDKIDVPEIVIISAEKTLRLLLPSMQVKERWLAAFRLCLSQLNSNVPQHNKPTYEYAPDNLPQYDHRGSVDNNGGNERRRSSSQQQQQQQSNLQAPSRGLVRRMTGHFEEPLFSTTHNDRMNSTRARELITVRNMQFQFEQKQSVRSQHRSGSQEAKPRTEKGTRYRQRRSRSGSDNSHYMSDIEEEHGDSDDVNDYDDGDYSDDQYSDDDNDIDDDNNNENDYEPSRSESGHHNGNVIAHEEQPLDARPTKRRSRTSTVSLPSVGLETIDESHHESTIHTSSPSPPTDSSFATPNTTMNADVYDANSTTAGYNQPSTGSNHHSKPTQYTYTGIILQMLLFFFIVTLISSLLTQRVLRSPMFQGDSAYPLDDVGLDGDQHQTPPSAQQPLASIKDVHLPSTISVYGHTYRFNTPNSRIISHAKLLQRKDQLASTLSRAYTPPPPFDIDLFMMLDGFAKEALHSYQLHSNSIQQQQQQQPHDTSKQYELDEQLLVLEDQILSHVKVYKQIYHRFFQPHIESQLHPANHQPQGSDHHHPYATIQIQYNHSMSRHQPNLEKIAKRLSNLTIDDSDEHHANAIHLRARIVNNLALIADMNSDTSSLESVLQDFHHIMSKTLPNSHNTPSHPPLSSEEAVMRSPPAATTANVLPTILSEDQFDAYTSEYAALSDLHERLELSSTPQQSSPGAINAYDTLKENDTQPMASRSLFSTILSHSFVPHSIRATFLIYTLVSLVICMAMAIGWIYQDDVMEALMSSTTAPIALTVTIIALLSMCTTLFNGIRTLIGVISCVVWLAPCVYMFFTPLTEWLTPSTQPLPCQSQDVSPPTNDYDDQTLDHDVGQQEPSRDLPTDDEPSQRVHSQQGMRHRRHRSASQERYSSDDFIQQQQQPPPRQGRPQGRREQASLPQPQRNRRSDRSLSPTHHQSQPRTRASSQQRPTNAAEPDQWPPQTSLHRSMALILHKHHPKLVKSPPIMKNYPLYQPVIPDRYLSYLTLLHKTFPLLLQTTDYLHRPEIWKDIGVYEEVKVQENTEVNANRQGGGLLARGRRIMPIPPAQVMSLLWDTSTKKFYDSMVDNVIPLEHINNHAKIERQIYKGKGVVSNRYLHVLAGWQHVLFHSANDASISYTTDFYTQPTSSSRSPSEEANTSRGPNYNNTWFYKSSELFNLYDNNTNPKQVHRPAPTLPPQDLPAYLRKVPTHCTEGYEYTADGFAMLAMTLPNYSQTQPSSLPSPDPSHVEAVLNLGGFLIRGVKIPLGPQNYPSGQTINEKETQKLVKLLPTTSKLYKTQERAHGGRFIYGCEVVGCGDISLNGLANFIQKHVCKSSPGLMTGGMNYLLKEKIKDKNNELLVDCIDVDYFYA